MAAFDIEKDKENFVVSKGKLEKIDGGSRGRGVGGVGKWAENHRQGKSLNDQMSEEGYRVQVKRHWVTLQVCTIKWATPISQKVISLHNSEVLWRVFIGTQWIINWGFFCFISKFGKSRGLISIRLKGEKRDFSVNWKIKQIIIWRLQLRHLNLKKNNASFWCKNNRDFWNKMFIWTTTKIHLKNNWKLFHWKFWIFFPPRY